MKSAERTERRAYSSPRLVKYGHMAEFTKGGTGSVTEAVSGNMSSNFRQ